MKSRIDNITLGDIANLLNKELSASITVEEIGNMSVGDVRALKSRVEEAVTGLLTNLQTLTGAEIIIARADMLRYASGKEPKIKFHISMRV